MKRNSSNFLVEKLMTLIFAFFSAEALAQQLPRITQFSEGEVEISLDGVVDEPVWQSVPESTV